MKNLYILIVVLIISLKSYAHKDILVTEKFGNIKIITKTGFYYEELNKTFMIGEYAKLLCNELKFKDTITIFFKHNYVEEMNSKFSIQKYKENKVRNFFITYESSKFDFIETLNIIEYIIKNNSKSMKCNLNNIVEKSQSELINNILSNKIYRPVLVKELTNSNNLSYYVQNGKYTFFYLKNDKEQVIFTTTEVYQFSSINSNIYIVFDTKKSFYCITMEDFLSLKKVNFDNENYYMPYSLNLVSENVINIILSKYQNEKKIISYNLATGLIGN